jgi:hypothetical protein
MATTIKGKNLDTTLITPADKPKQLENGSKFVWIGYKNAKLSVQTPPMNVAFNMGVYDKGEYPKYSVELSFGGMDEDPSLKKFYENMSAMDEYIIDEGVKNSMAWFKAKKTSRDVVEAKYSRMIKTPTDKETGEVLSQYPQRLRLKIPFYDGKFGCEVFDKDGNKIEDAMEDILVRGTRVKAIVECVGLWIASASYMCQWKVVRMEADVQKVSRGPAFLPDTDDEGDDDSAPAVVAKPVAVEDEPPAVAAAKPVAAATPPTMVADTESEDEDSDAESGSDDEESEEEAPPPPPEPKKKAAKEKKAKK